MKARLRNISFIGLTVMLLFIPLFGSASLIEAPGDTIVFDVVDKDQSGTELGRRTVTLTLRDWGDQISDNKISIAAMFEYESSNVTGNGAPDHSSTWMNDMVELEWWEIADLNNVQRPANPATSGPISLKSRVLQNVQHYLFEHTITGLQSNTLYAFRIFEIQPELDFPEDIYQAYFKTSATATGSTGGTSGTTVITQTTPKPPPIQQDCNAKDGEYCLIEPLPGLEKVGPGDDFGKYFNTIFKIAIGVVGVLSVLVLVIGGIQYMGTESVFAKGEAKKQMLGAVGGLLLALASVLILQTINPNILSFDVYTDLEGVSVQGKSLEQLYGDVSAPIQPISSQTISDLSIYCPKSGGVGEIPKIVDSMKGKITYRLGGKGGEPPYYEQLINGEPRQCNDGTCNDYCPAGSICLDCSGFVKHVLSCAGITSVSGSWTGDMFDQQNTLEEVTSVSGNGKKVNSKDLEIGDILGWKGGENPAIPGGHVVMYIGGGNMAEVVGTGRDEDGKPAGQALITTRSVKFGGYNYKWIIRLSDQ